jgi:hypothetical protein
MNHAFECHLSYVLFFPRCYKSALKRQVKPLGKVRFTILATASMKMTDDLLDTAPCSLVKVDRRFRGAYC